MTKMQSYNEKTYGAFCEVDELPRASDVAEKCYVQVAMWNDGMLLGLDTLFFFSTYYSILLFSKALPIILFHVPIIHFLLPIILNQKN